jgi:hypothetical protein
MLHLDARRRVLVKMGFAVGEHHSRVQLFKARRDATSVASEAPSASTTKATSSRFRVVASRWPRYRRSCTTITAPRGLVRSPTRITATWIAVDERCGVVAQESASSSASLRMRSSSERQVSSAG